MTPDYPGDLHDAEARDADSGARAANGQAAARDRAGPRTQTLLLRGLEWMGVTGIVYALTVAYSILVNRMLGPEERGRLAVVLAVSSAGSNLLHAGLGLVGRGLVALEHRRFRSIHRSLSRYSAVIAIAAFSLAVFLWTTNLVPLPPATGHLVCFGIIGIPVLVYSTFWQCLCQGAGLYRIINIQRLVRPILDLACMATALGLFLRTAETAAVSWLAAGSLAALFAVLQVRGRRDDDQDGPGLHDMVPSGLRLALSALLVGIQPQVTLLLLASRTSAATVGVYAASFGLAYQLGSLVATGAVVSADRLGTGSRATASSHAARLGRFTVVLGLAAGLLLLVLGSTILSVLYGKGFAWGGMLLAILASGGIVGAVVEALGQYIIAHEPDAGALCLRMNALNLGIFSILLFFGLLGFSSHGAAAALSLSYIANAAVYSFVVARRTGHSLWHFVVLQRNDITDVSRRLFSRG